MFPDASLTIGAIFQGGYEILTELGAGSFGRVYKARQLSTGPEVAINILRVMALVFDNRSVASARPTTMSQPSFFDVALSQRAHRVLKPDPIEDALIERILDAATHAPSAENRQPWVFVVVRDADVRSQIAESVRQAWERGIRDYAQAQLGERFFAGVERWATVGLGEAPVLIVVCGDTSLCDASLLPSSVFPATQNLLLAAHALGLGSLLSTLPVLVGGALGELLTLPAHITPMAAVPIGWPARPLRPPTRVSFHAKTFRDTFGQPW